MRINKDEFKICFNIDDKGLQDLINNKKLVLNNDNHFDISNENNRKWIYLTPHILEMLISYKVYNEQKR